jgi:curved DNA-binding protein CbpA
MEVIRAAYKALAMLYHPDLGGDPNAMVALNQAYETLLEKN